MARQVPHFEVLRGLLALWVLISHALMVVDLRVPILANGGLAVEVFIILSGFVIALMRTDKPEPYSTYLFRRFMRLYPMLVVALVAGALTVHMYEYAVGDSPWAADLRPQYMTRESNTFSAFWAQLALHLGMMHGVVPDTILPQAPLTFSGPLWSISLEWQFYLVAPFLVWMMVTGGRARLLIVAALFLFAILIERFVAVRWRAEVPSLLPLRLDLFLLGMVGGVCWQQARELPPWLLAVAIAVVGAVASFVAPSTVPLAVWGVVYFLAATDSRMRWARLSNLAFNHPACRYLGRVSYSFYVLHMSVLLVVTTHVVIPIAGDAPKLVALALICAITLPLTLALSGIAYRFIEQPIITWAREALRPRAPGGMAASPLHNRA